MAPHIFAAKLTVSQVGESGLNRKPKKILVRAQF